MGWKATALGQTLIIVVQFAFCLQLIDILLAMKTQLRDENLRMYI